METFAVGAAVLQRACHARQCTGFRFGAGDVLPAGYAAHILQKYFILLLIDTTRMPSTILILAHVMLIELSAITRIIPKLRRTWMSTRWRSSTASAIAPTVMIPVVGEAEA